MRSPFDRALEYNVGAPARLITVNEQRAQFTLPLPACESLRADDLDTVYYQVLGPHGEYLSGQIGLPAPAEDEKIVPGEVRMRDDEFRRWHQSGLHLGAAGHPQRPSGLGASGRNHGQALGIGDRNCQRRDAAAICGAATGRAAGLAGTGPGDQAAAPPGRTHPRPRAPTT